LSLKLVLLVHNEAKGSWQAVFLVTLVLECCAAVMLLDFKLHGDRFSEYDLWVKLAGFAVVANALRDAWETAPPYCCALGLPYVCRWALSVIARKCRVHPAAAAWCDVVGLAVANVLAGVGVALMTRHLFMVFHV
jgi:hypothetical protein